MASFWLRKRQVVVMDGHSSGPARNLNIRPLTVLLLFLALIAGCLMIGAWYAPFHSMQDIIPENIQLKRQNNKMQHQIADVTTLNDLKDEQLNSLKEQITLQENEIISLTKQLHMYRSILDERKGTGVHILESSASWKNEENIAWKALFVKGGSYPRYILGTYDIFAIGDEGQREALNKDAMRYRIESHIFLQSDFEWTQAWQPIKLELVVYDSRKKELLRKIIQIKGKQ